MAESLPHDIYGSEKRAHDAREGITGEHFPDFAQVFPEIARDVVRQAGLIGDPHDYNFYIRRATYSDYVNGIRSSHVVEVSLKTNSESAPLRGDNSWNNMRPESRNNIDY